MKTYFECYPCFVRQVVNTAKMATTNEDTQWKILREVLQTAHDFSPEMSPAQMGREIYRIIREFSGNNDPFLQIKKEFNLKAKELLPQMENLLQQSHDSFVTGVKLAAIGNIIDFGPSSEISDLQSFILEKLETKIIEKIGLEQFKEDINSSSSILYIADNCGEIVFDSFFINQFLSNKTVYLATRTRPVLNDITRDDLDGIYFGSNVQIIDSGTDAPGVVLDTCNAEFIDLFYKTDMIIAKGQGNYEALSEIDREHLYNLLIAKCNVVANHIGCQQGDLVLTCPN